MIISICKEFAKRGNAEKGVIAEENSLAGLFPGCAYNMCIVVIGNIFLMESYKGHRVVLRIFVSSCSKGEPLLHLFIVI